MTEEEKRLLEEAREQRFGKGRRVTTGCMARILAEEYLQSEEEP